MVVMAGVIVANKDLRLDAFDVGKKRCNCKPGSGSDVMCSDGDNDNGDQVSVSRLGESHNDC